MGAFKQRHRTASGANREVSKGKSGSIVEFSSSAHECGSDTEGVVSRTEELILKISELLVEAAHPKQIILFGSRARGDSESDSDFDVVVVEELPFDCLQEMVRLNRVLRTFDAAIDLLVVSDERFQYWRDTPGNVYHEAASHGRILYEAA